MLVPVPATIQSGLETERDGLLKAENAIALTRRQNIYRHTDTNIRHTTTFPTLVLKMSAARIDLSAYGSAG